MPLGSRQSFGQEVKQHVISEDPVVTLEAHKDTLVIRRTFLHEADRSQVILFVSGWPSVDFETTETLQARSRDDIYLLRIAEFKSSPYWSSGLYSRGNNSAH